MRNHIPLSTTMIAACTAALVLAGVVCSEPVPAEVPGQHSLSSTPLAGTDWQLVEFQSMDDAIGTVRPEVPAGYTMKLMPDGKVVMQLNCNTAQGTWSAAPGDSILNGRFEFGPLAATRAQCHPPGMEEDIAAQSEYIRGYLLKDNRLYLSLMADGGIYVWESPAVNATEAAVPAAPEDGGPLDWVVSTVSDRLNLRAEPSITAKVIASYTPGTILDNLGCRRAAGRVWCDVQELGGGPRGFVAATYLKPAVSPDGSVITGPENSALRAGQGQFDATGTVPCALSAGHPMSQCEFGVSRSGGGYATVVIYIPEGPPRIIFFRMGIPIGASMSEAGGYFDFKAAKENDLHIIRLGSERYEIPDAVILGG